MYKYRNHQNISVRRPAEISISKVQKGLVPSLRVTLQRAQNGFSVGQFDTLPPDSFPPQYSQLSFTDLYQRLNELETWYNTNKDEIDKTLSNKSDAEPSVVSVDRSDQSSSNE